MKSPSSSPASPISLPPKLVLVDMRGTYQVLDGLAAQPELPMIDVEALMSSIFPVLDTYASGSFRQAAYLQDLDYITEELFRVADPSDFEFSYSLVRRNIHHAILRSYWQLQLSQVFVQDRLPYNYVQRKHSGSALLERCKDFRPD